MKLMRRRHDLEAALETEPTWVTAVVWLIGALMSFVVLATLWLAGVFELWLDAWRSLGVPV